MNKNELLKIKEMAQGEKYDEILDKIKEAYKDANRTDLSGWKIDVVMDADEVWTTGLMSQNSTLQSVWNGETVVIASIGILNVLEGFDLTEEIKNHDDYVKIKVEFEDNSEYDSFYEFIDNEYYEIKEKLEEEYLELYFEEYGDQFAEQKLDEFLENLEIKIENMTE